MIGQGTFRLLLTKSFNITSLSNSALSYIQFEETLRQISLRLNTSKTESQKLSMFIKKISDAFQVYKHQTPKRSRRPSNDLSYISNESSELDLNIKEALEALKNRGARRSSSRFSKK